MLTSTVISFMLALLQLLTTLTINVSALPITSKPIEGTAEHLAWQAWLMLPPEQKNLEKSRKVTPKSIFTLPFRECPSGHQLFENRCIPTVNIDQTALLTQQLLGFVVGDNNNNNNGDGDGDNNYEFDYDDIGTDEIVDILYDPAEKFINNNNDNSNSKESFHYDQLPSQDEPLKFNIFQQKFPTDYEAESPPPNDEFDETKLSNSTVANIVVVHQNATTMTSLAEAANVDDDDVPPKPNESKNTTKINLNQNQNENQNENKTNSIVDLQMDSSNVSKNIAENISINNNKNNNKNKNIDDIVTPSTTFSVSDIDAIVLPAVPTHNSNLESNDPKNLHKFSLFKDDSSVQLITSSLLTTDRGNEPSQKQPDLKQLLKAENLLPLPNITTTTTKVIGSLNIESESDAESDVEMNTRTTEILNDNDVSTTTTTLSTSLGSNSNSSGGDDNRSPDGSSSVEVTDMMMLSDVETTMETLLDDLLDEHEDEDDEEKVVTPAESGYDHTKKEERTRSVLIENKTEKESQEDEKFMTSTEPDATTNFQANHNDDHDDEETTVEELHDAPTIALKELLELAQHHPPVGPHENLGVVVKKSKVEPVEPIPPIITETDIDSSVIIATEKTTTTTKATTTKSTSSAMNLATEVSTSSILLPTAATQIYRFDNLERLKNSSETDEQNRLRNENSNAGGKQNDDDGDGDGDGDNHLRNIKITAKPTIKASEIDIKQELRLINELVKGNSNKNNNNNNNNNNKKKQYKGEIIKSLTTNTAESRLTTMLQNPTKNTATERTTTKSTSTTTTITTTKSNDEESRTSGEMTSTSKSTSAVKSLPTSSSSLSSPTTTTSSTTTMASTTVKTMMEPTKIATTTTTLWSKIMPFLGFSSPFGEITTETTEAIPNDKTVSNTNSTETTKTTKSSKNIENSINRSNRNSKIIKINNLSTPNSGGNNFVASKIFYSTTETPTTTTTTATNTEVFDSSSIDFESDPFWWLPLGWRLDRPSDGNTDDGEVEVEGSADDPSLFLRLWSPPPH